MLHMLDGKLVLASYDCDFIDALLSTTLFCANVGRGTNTTYHNGAGAFYLHLISLFLYYAADLGACLMIVIGYGLLKNQLCRFLYVVDVMAPVIVQVSS